MKPYVNDLTIHDATRIRIQRDLHNGCLCITVEGTSDTKYIKHPDIMSVTIFAHDDLGEHEPPPVVIEEDRPVEDEDEEETV